MTTIEEKRAPVSRTGLKYVHVRRSPRTAVERPNKELWFGGLKDHLPPVAEIWATAAEKPNPNNYPPSQENLASSPKRELRGKKWKTRNIQQFSSYSPQ